MKRIYIMPSSSSSCPPASLPLHLCNKVRANDANSGPDHHRTLNNNRVRRLPDRHLLQPDVNRVERNVEEVVDKHPRARDQSRKHTTGFTDALPAAQEVLEAALLDQLEVLVVGGEEAVQRHGQNVDDG